MTNYKITDDGGAVVATFVGTVGDTVAIYAYGPGHTAGLLLGQFVAKPSSAGVLVPGTYGDAITVPQITVNAQGIITSIKAVPIVLSVNTILTTEKPTP